MANDNLGPKGIPESSSATELQESLWNAESFEDWNAVMNTNVSAVYFTTIAFLPLLQAALKNGFPARSPPSSSSPACPV